MKNYFILVENQKTFETTCYFINSNYEVQSEIVPAFGDDGEFANEVNEGFKKYDVNWYSPVNTDKLLFFGDTLEQGIENLRFELEEVPKLEQFLTPDMEQRLFNLFKK